MTDVATDLLALLARGPRGDVTDPYAVYARLRDEAPALAIPGLGAGLFVLSRYDDVRAALRDDALFSNRANARGASLVMGRTLIEMDGAEHLRHRKLVTPALAPRALRGDFPKLVERIAHEIVDGFPRGDVDLVEAFTFVFPLRVFVEILGLPTDDVAALHACAADLTLVQADPDRAFAASRRMRELLLPVVARKRAEPGDDLISTLAAAEVDGTRLGDEEVVSFLRLLVSAGAETTFHLLGSALHVLLDDPELQALVRARRDRIDDLLWETLRFETPVAILPREATRATEIAGVAIPEGADVLLLVGSASRDERRWREPDRFDIDRDNAETLSFGLGRHYCAGSRLALLEARIGLEALLDRTDALALAPGE
ncbi:MAG: cytochrome P450, partial [Myxococcales bacterium]|nr:cytochrome P450 [Myxococcales bacterium]